MKEVCSLPLAADANPEHYLLESMPEEDQAALFPIIKMAFPILEWRSVQSFCPSQVPLNMQMAYQHRSPLSQEVHANPDDGSRTDEALCSSHVDHDHTTAQCLVLPSAMGPHRVTQVSERVAPEESCTMADDKLLQSLSAGCSSKPCLAMGECMLDCTSSEYPWLQQQDMCSLSTPVIQSEASLGVPFSHGDHVRKRVSAENSLDLNYGTSCKSSESNTVRGVSDTEATRRQGVSKQSLALAINKRKCVSTCDQEYDLKSNSVQATHAMTEDVESSEEKKVRCSGVQLEGTLAVGECSDKLARTHVPVPAILDATVEQLKLERCHRSNGKQWRCAKNATPGTLYCEIHHKYRSKRRIKKSISPGKACFLEQKRAAFLKEKQANVARCHRTDGNLWQCSKLAMPGSSYCENHRNRRKKSKTPLKATSFTLRNNESVAEGNHATTLKNGNRLNETSTCRSIQNSGLMQLCNLIARGRDMDLKACGHEGKKLCGVMHEDGPGKKPIQIVQKEDVAGLLRLTDKQEQDRVEPLLSHISSPEQKNVANGLGQLLEQCVRSKASWALKENSGFLSWHASGSRPSAAEPEADKEEGFVLCRRNDGKQWVCSQPSKAGSSYCKHHQPKAKAGKTTQAKGHKQKRIPNTGTRSPYEDTYVQGVDSVDDCLAGITCHKEQLQEQLSGMISQEVRSLKQCQRRDGKSWQCSKDAKEGQNYCLHHLEYLSKRKACNLHENGEGSSIVSPPHKLAAAIPTTRHQGLSARESVYQHSPDNPVNSLAEPLNRVCSHEDPNHTGKVSRESSGGNQNLNSSLDDPLNAFCKPPHLTPAREAARILEEQSSVDESIQKQEVCASVNHPLPEINLPQRNSRQEICAYFDSSIQYQHHSMLGTSILSSQNQESCITHNSYSETRCNKGSCNEGKKDQSLQESKQGSGSLSQGTSSLKQCQRKDGKGWQCSKSAKQGQNYCSYHLVYLRNRRKPSKSARRDNRQIASQDRSLVCTGDGLPLSVTPNVPQTALSVRKSVSKIGTLSSDDIQSSLAEPVNEASCNQSHSDRQKQESSTGEMAQMETTPQELYSVACKSISKQGICAGPQLPCT